MCVYRFLRRSSTLRRLLASLSLKLYLRLEGEALLREGVGRFVLPRGTDLEKARCSLGLPEEVSVLQDEAGNVVLLDWRLLMREALIRAGFSQKEAEGLLRRAKDS
jgi:hypothetical protein